MSTAEAADPATATGSNDNDDYGLQYHHGYGNQFESEAYPNALPHGRNNPRLVPHGLYTEKLSGTAFTAPRNENRQTWLYRIQPSVVGTSHSFHPCGGGARSGGGSGSGAGEGGGSGGANAEEEVVRASLPEIFGQVDWTKDMKLDPNPLRWGATPLVDSSTTTSTAAAAAAAAAGGGGHDHNINFIQGIHTLAGSGDPTTKSGLGIYVYACNTNMSGTTTDNEDHREEDGAQQQNIHMYNSDGDFLIVPQQRTLWIQTELGRMTVMPGEFCIIPRGVVFTVNIMKHSKADEEQVGGSGDSSSSFARGYILEIFRGHFQLPELGPIGSNGLANARDFLHPKAYYESNKTVANRACTIVNKFGQHLFARVNPHSPYNVVAWHGNYLPCKYDLRRFCAINSVTYDHLDPSINTVLTAKGGDEDGTALADFVVFIPRVMATDENTFRPPWFHRNVMTEFMGLIYGEYDAKSGRSGATSTGFVPGGASLHSIMTPHGPDTKSYFDNVEKPCDAPTKFDSGIAFMFESSAMCRVSRYALECSHREMDYGRCWDGLVGTSDVLD